MERHARFAVIALVLGCALTVGTVRAIGAGQRDSPQVDTIASLSAQVRVLQSSVKSLRLRVQTLESGKPGLSLSPEQAYSRIQNLDFKLANLCRIAGADC